MFFAYESSFLFYFFLFLLNVAEVKKQTEKQFF